MVAQTLQEANDALTTMMEKKALGDSGTEIVVEEFMVGQEISVHAFCDGERAVMFPSSQDHKQVYDNDQGPNTGGMGTIAPVPWVSKATMEDIRTRIVEPLMQAMKKRGMPFKGVLYPGLMITSEGPKVVEVNARFGDPETESYVLLLESDLVELCFACIEGALTPDMVRWSTKAACSIVIASGGYPGSYEIGKPITGVSELRDPVVAFHAGTKEENEQLYTNGGRVLNISAVGATLPEALEKAYQAAEKVEFEGKHMRRDIGARPLPQ